MQGRGDSGCVYLYFPVDTSHAAYKCAVGVESDGRDEVPQMFDDDLSDVNSVEDEEEYRSQNGSMRNFPVHIHSGGVICSKSNVLSAAGRL